MRFAFVIETIGECVAIERLPICIAQRRETYNGRRVYVFGLQPPEEVRKREERYVAKRHGFESGYRKMMIHSHDAFDGEFGDTAQCNEFRHRVGITFVVDEFFREAPIVQVVPVDVPILE